MSNITKAEKAGGWSDEQAKVAAKALRKELGLAWNYMTEDTRQAFADMATMRFVRSVSGMDRGAFVDPDWIVALGTAIRRHLGMEGY